MHVIYIDNIFRRPAMNMTTAFFMCKTLHYTYSTLPCEQLNSKRTEAQSLPRVLLNDIDLNWLQTIGEGWAAPLKGFMREVRIKEYNVVAGPKIYALSCLSCF